MNTSSALWWHFCVGLIEVIPVKQSCMLCSSTELIVNNYHSFNITFAVLNTAQQRKLAIISTWKRLEYVYSITIIIFWHTAVLLIDMGIWLLVSHKIICSIHQTCIHLSNDIYTVSWNHFCAVVVEGMVNIILLPCWSKLTSSRLWNARNPSLNISIPLEKIS